eukprot:CAMPEP_0184696388 /NCGR_PEP_ID=MMETSP0313-20130426/3705_1 /TAXON_ID=2792 /ORGANISM="Porphyridium aerugineum, Strain SAG 1380-2" /LENGTH=49 /DNA_ID= /DNA_START= /DNA_END= /DNA_ORIENTATION=
MVDDRKLKDEDAGWGYMECPPLKALKKDKCSKNVDDSTIDNSTRRNART